MKLLASLLIAIATVTGALAAATAYLVPLSIADDRLVGLTLDAPAGLRSATAAQNPAPAQRDASAPDERESLGIDPREPIANAGEVLDAALIEELRVAGTPRVRVTEFSFSRWPGKWAFLGSAAGLLAGALMLRQQGKAPAAAGDAAQTLGAGPALDRCEEMLAALRERLGTAGPDDADLHAITKSLGEIQAGPIAAFIADRPAIIARIGLAGYARTMDRFAAFERSVNRGWSAATDGAAEESLACIDRAPALLTQARDALNG